MSEQLVVARPAGTRALIYAVLSVVAAVVTYVIGLVVLRIADGFAGLVLTGFLVALAQAVIALVVGLVQRLAGQRTESIDVRRIALWACGVPAALTVIGLLIDLVAS